MLAKTLKKAARRLRDSRLGDSRLRDRSGLLGLGLAMLLIGTGCGRTPGDYYVYRLAFSAPELTPDCYGGTVPTDEAEDTSTMRTPGTFIMYFGPNDSFFLDIGSDTLQGTESGAGFAFAGSSFDVNISGVAPDEVRTSLQRDINIDFTLDGELIEGNFHNFEATTCSGPVGMCPDPANTACTQSSTFLGTEVDDVRIEHEL